MAGGIGSRFWPLSRTAYPKQFLDILGTQVGEMMMVPTNILDRWIERFNRKYQIDPNFMMKDIDNFFS
jgi:mannose-1-phosphate guanylyltransferase